MDSKITVLMTGAGAPGAPGIIKALLTDDEIDLHVADMNSGATGKFLAKNFHLIPKATDDNFISFLLELCKKFKIEVLFPLVTMELFKLSKWKHQFQEVGTEVIVSEFKDLSIVNDKCALYQHLQNHSIKCPLFKTVNSTKELKKVAMEFGYPNLPVVMKPCIANGSRGMRILDVKKYRFNLVFEEKPNAIYSNLEEILSIANGRKLPKMVISEFLPGQELTIDAHVSKGRVDYCLTRTRNSMSGGISVSGWFVRNDSIEEYVNKIVETLPGLNGPIGFQVKESASGDFLLLESNPRIQGTSTAAMGLGINLPLNSVYSAIGRRIPTVNLKSGVCFSRYYEEVFYDS